jgi:hypothetical protein
MLTTVKGVYEDGVILLDEKPEGKKRAKVIVTFLEDSISKNEDNKVIMGTLKGKVGLPDNFNEPLDDLKDYMH